MDYLKNDVLKKLERKQHITIAENKLRSLDNTSVFKDTLEFLVNIGSYNEHKRNITDQQYHSYIKTKTLDFVNKNKLNIVCASTLVSSLFFFDQIKDIKSTEASFMVLGVIGILNFSNKTINNIIKKNNERAFFEEEIIKNLSKISKNANSQYKNAKIAFEDNDELQLKMSKIVRFIRKFKPFFIKVKENILEEGSLSNKFVKLFLGKNFLNKIKNIDFENDLTEKEKVFKILSQYDLSDSNKNKNEVDKEINDDYKKITKDLYEDYLNKGIILITEKSINNIIDLYFDNIIDSSIKNNEIIENIKILTNVSKLKNSTSNDPLNKYTLISNIASKFKNIYLSEIDNMKDKKTSIFSELKESELIKLKSSLFNNLEYKLKEEEKILGDRKKDIEQKINRVLECTLNSESFNPEKTNHNDELKSAAIDFINKKIEFQKFKIKQKQIKIKK